MTNRELDALMWKLLNGGELITEDCRYVDGDVQPHAGYPIGHISPDHYSTDMNAALEVMEFMKSSWDQSIPNPAKFWRISSLRNGKWNVFIGEENGTFDTMISEYSGFSLPECICKVALIFNEHNYTV